ncbi:GGDEF domain-containing protein [Blastococcus sp. PRF04-17]|uniref:GGDEF domain-containing protein n=1 Tax=Blastococcus sp. PRF04-17 TaxID=2933797 RepID=UPI001FF1DE13|nr:GGDEF domain-containing protein [Blastococcus sp. PRF04-17]UOY00483.1 GGDEF domain-containing protein [Blastococcus sp. PRF04-17]
MIAGLVHRVAAMLRRGDVLPPAAPSPGADGAVGGDRRSPDALTTRSSLRELTAAVPALRDELANRARTAGLLVGIVAVIAVPTWTVVDRLAVPHLTELFLVVRLACDIPMLLAMYALWRLPIGRRRPEILTFLVLAVVQIEIAWMIVQTHGHEYYLLGFTLAVYGSGCILVARPRWTAAVVALSWLALAFFAAVQPGRLAAEELITVSVFLATASLIGMLAHLRRYALNQRELVTRVRLEREQQRTGILLAQLERLSHEDALTGLANRRRWDSELGDACTDARRRETVVAMVLVDIDHFKTINDRHGHPGGDEALRHVAALLSRRVRNGDLVARLGGDELAVLMPGADLERACELAETLRVEAAELRPDGFGPREISLSLGVATATGHEAYPVELLARADEQLYRAKITRNAVGSPRRDASIPLPR